jgi:hypothetical protein
MKTYYQLSTDIFAINGIIAVSMSDEIRNQLDGKQEFLEEKSKEVQAYLTVTKQKEAEAIASRRATRSVSIRAGREALITAGVLDKIEAAINAMTDAKEKALAKNWLEYSQVYMRNNPFLIKMTTALKMTPEQVDALFDEAEKLEVK